MFEGVQNYRDFGGYPTSDGGSVKRGLLFRSAKLSTATAADEKALDGFGFSAVIDLRRPSERNLHPTGAWLTRRPVVVTNDIGGDADPWTQFLRVASGSGDYSADAIRRFATEFYVSAPYDDRHVDLFSRYFRELTAANAPILVHCTAGKDRTGMIVALTHHLLGVGHADIVEDYLLTNQRWDFAAHSAAIAATMAREVGRDPGEPAIRAAMEVHVEFIETMFATILDRSGSVDAYLSEVLGVTDDDRNILRTRLIERPR